MACVLCVRVFCVILYVCVCSCVCVHLCMSVGVCACVCLFVCICVYVMKQCSHIFFVKGILLDIRQTNRPTDRQICILNLVAYFPGELVTKFIVFF